MTSYQHLIVEEDAHQIAWVGINRKEESVNSINEALPDELNALFQSIQKNTNLKGLVIYSAKEKGFIAGADIHSLQELKTQQQVADFLRKGQACWNRLEALTIPTVAMIDGFCMGGGLELALACRYRVVSAEEGTRLGLPEILLGFHPGWGGAVRLPRLIGGFHALTEFMLSGKAVSAKKAKALGLVDAVVPQRQLKKAALDFVITAPKPHQATGLQRFANTRWMRSLLARVMRYQVAKKVKKEHYPAPFALIDFWEKEGGSYGDRAYLKEAESVETLISTGTTAQNLIRLFRLRERLKDFAKQSDFKARHLHVIGVGVMGGDIAAWAALKGLNVTLQDQSYERIAPAIARAAKLFKKKLKNERLVQAALDRLTPDPDGLGIQRADVIIEAVFEDLKVKQALFERIEREAKNDALLATNTSSILLDDISQSMKSPERLLGIHFFNPVPLMEVVEVVSAAKTQPLFAEQAYAFVNQIDRLPLPVKSSPGFLINRILMPYLLECLQLIEEGYSGEVIDKAAMDFGMFMGPVELADTVGLDICLAVAENLTSHFGGKVPERIREMVAAGKLGRKSGEGYYRYKNGKAIKQTVKAHEASNEIAQRLVLRMVNEASACLRDAVVTDSDLVDAGMVFGTGFAPFRGGPMHYAEQFGEGQLNDLFKSLESKYGDRFKLKASIK